LARPCELACQHMAVGFPKTDGNYIPLSDSEVSLQVGD
jgi:hypothetical protein